jgi:hypothetical protein
MTSGARELVRSGVDLARSILRRLKSDPDAFIELCRLQDATPQIALDKLVAETALFAMLARRCLGDESIDDLAREIAPLARTDAHRELLSANPHAAAGLALAHACLEQLGFGDEDFGRLLASCASDAAIERPVFRQMEQRWLASVSASAGPPRCDDLIGDSVVANPSSAPWGESAAYAFTHEVFYLTDFGRYPFPEGLLCPKLDAAMDDAIAAQIGLNNLDLLAELCMARRLTGAAASPAAKLGDALVVESWKAYGFLPGPNFRMADLELLDAGLRTTYFALGVYHTTYVGALYLITKLQSGPPFAELAWTEGPPSRALRWLPALRKEDAPILERILTRAPEEVEPALTRAAAECARSGG